jgi:sec-independent protein translocase protein TatC
VTDILNTLLDRPELQEAPELAKLEGTDDNMTAAIETLRARREEGELSENDSRRFNRLLLTAAFPGYVGPPRVRLVDLPFWTPIDIKVQSLGAQEAFMIWMKAAFIVGLVISAPWVFLKIWQFVAAGLYPHEKHYIYLYLPVSLLLFFGGAALAFFFVFQPVLSFLFSFNKSMNIDPDPRISEWLSFVLFLPLGFGISFQLPLVMLFLQRIGIFTVEMYIAKWRIAILAIFVISMVLTPADPISMMLMACPLSVLYFGGLAMCKWMPRGRNPYSDLQTYEP